MFSCFVFSFEFLEDEVSFNDFNVSAILALAFASFTGFSVSISSNSIFFFKFFNFVCAFASICTAFSLACNTLLTKDI